MSLYGLKFFVKRIKKVKLANFYKPLGMEVQQWLAISLFQKIRKIVKGNNLVIIMGGFNYPDCKSLDTFKVKLDEFMIARGEI